MKKIAIVFLQIVLVIVVLIALAIMIKMPLIEGRATNLDIYSIYTDPFILYGYLATIPFFVALFNAFKLLGFMAQNTVFSTDGIKALRNIKYCALLLGVLIVLAGVFVMSTHPKDDDPAGFLAICIVITFIAIVVAAAAAIFERLLKNAHDMKSEIDLTV